MGLKPFIQWAFHVNVDGSCPRWHISVAWLWWDWYHEHHCELRGGNLDEDGEYTSRTWSLI